MKNTNCKTKIRDTFWDLLSTKDINQIHVKEITEILGINRSTFYLYYDSIYDILQEIEDNFFCSNSLFREAVCSFSVGRPVFHIPTSWYNRFS